MAEIPDVAHVAAPRCRTLIVHWVDENHQELGTQELAIDGKFLPPICAVLRLRLDEVELR